MSFGQNPPTARICPACHAAIPLPTLVHCPVCNADLKAPPSPGAGLVEALTGVLNDPLGKRKPKT